MHPPTHRILFLCFLLYGLYIGDYYLAAGMAFALAEEYLSLMPKIVFWLALIVVVALAVNAFLDFALLSGLILLATSISMGWRYLDRLKAERLKAE